MNFAAVVTALESLRNAVNDIRDAVESGSVDSNIAAADEQLAVLDDAIDQIKKYGPDA
jgi:hypothetical protein